MASKAEQLFETVKQQILRGGFARGEKFPGGREFASSYGVSYLTADKVLKKLEQEGFLHRYPRRGSFVTLPADNFSCQSETYKAGYFVDVNISYFGRYFRELLNLTADQDIYNIPLDMTPTNRLTSPETYQKWLEMIFRKHYNSVTIYADRHYPFKEFQKYAHQTEQINFIFYDSSAIEFPGANRFVVDLEKVGYLGATHLFNCGATKILMSTVVGLSSAYRLQMGVKAEDHEYLIVKGIERAFRERNIDFWKNFKTCESVFTTEADYIRLIRDEKFDGFFSLSNMYFERLFYAARALNLKLEKDIFCVETGNSSWHNIYVPPLSSISFNEKEIARLTACAMREKWQDKYIAVEPELIPYSKDKRKE